METVGLLGLLIIRGEGGVAGLEEPDEERVQALIRRFLIGFGLPGVRGVLSLASESELEGNYERTINGRNS